MESVKCQECGLVSWPDAETISCKRCGGPIWKKNDYGAGFTYNEPSEAFFSGVIKFLTIGLGVAVLVLIICKGIGLGDVSKVMAVLIMLVGLALALGMKIWFLAAVFGESVGWGLASIFLPFGALIALIKFWDKTRRPFVGHLISSGIIMAGFIAFV